MNCVLLSSIPLPIWAAGPWQVQQVPSTPGDGEWQRRGALMAVEGGGGTQVWPSGRLDSVPARLSSQQTEHGADLLQDSHARRQRGRPSGGAPPASASGPFWEPDPPEGFPG